MIACLYPHRCGSDGVECAHADCPSAHVIWRPLLMSEYPPPGPTKLGPRRGDGTRVILVAEPRGA